MVKNVCFVKLLFDKNPKKSDFKALLLPTMKVLFCSGFNELLQPTMKVLFWFQRIAATYCESNLVVSFYFDTNTETTSCMGKALLKLKERSHLVFVTVWTCKFLTIPISYLFVIFVAENTVYPQTLRHRFEIFHELLYFS